MHTVQVHHETSAAKYRTCALATHDTLPTSSARGIPTVERSYNAMPQHKAWPPSLQAAVFQTAA